MKLQCVTNVIPQLAGEGALDYDIKADGLLVVIDAQGRKVCFTPAQFEPILKEGRLANGGATALAGEHIDAAAQADASMNGKAAKKGRRA